MSGLFSICSFFFCSLSSHFIFFFLFSQPMGKLSYFVPVLTIEIQGMETTQITGLLLRALSLAMLSGWFEEPGGLQFVVCFNIFLQVLFSRICKLPSSFPSFFILVCSLLMLIECHLYSTTHCYPTEVFTTCTKALTHISATAVIPGPSLTHWLSGID